MDKISLELTKKTVDEMLDIFLKKESEMESDDYHEIIMSIIASLLSTIILNHVSNICRDEPLNFLDGVHAFLSDVNRMVFKAALSFNLNDELTH